jgi:hypothetical protein
MQSVEIATARHLVQTAAITRAAIECYDGRRWCIVLRGRADFVLRSERQNPRPFATIETALVELKALGLRHAEIDFARWDRQQNTLV